MSALIEPSDLHRYSIEEYHHLIEIGAFEDTPHVELIDGHIVDLSLRSPQHENAVCWLTRWLFAHVDTASFDILVTASLTIGNSEPEPDIAIIDSAPPTLAHPSSARLCIEVAWSSAQRDLKTKPRIYAPAVEEYWVVDLDRLCVVVHHDPAADGYAAADVIPRGETVAAQALDIGAIPTDELFAYALAEPR